MYHIDESTRIFLQKLFTIIFPLFRYPEYCLSKKISFLSVIHKMKLHNIFIHIKKYIMYVYHFFSNYCIINVIKNVEVCKRGISMLPNYMYFLKISQPDVILLFNSHSMSITIYGFPLTYWLVQFLERKVPEK